MTHSLYCTPGTYIIWCSNYISIKEEIREISLKKSNSHNLKKDKVENKIFSKKKTKPNSWDEEARYTLRIPTKQSPGVGVRGEMKQISNSSWSLQRKEKLSRRKQGEKLEDREKGEAVYISPTAAFIRLWCGCLCNSLSPYYIYSRIYILSFYFLVNFISNLTFPAI